MRSKTITNALSRTLSFLLTVLITISGFAWLSGGSKAYADTATIEHSGEWADFYQTKLKTGTTYRDEFYTINGEFTFCIDVTTGTVAGASYWSEDMDPEMAKRIGLYDRYMQEAYPSWDYHLRYGYLQYMIWCEYMPDFMEENYRPEAADFWDVYAEAKAYYAQNKDGFSAEGTEWYSDESQNVCIMPRLIELGGVFVRKVDSDTGDAAQGDATLAGAKLDIVNRNDGPVVVEGATYSAGEVCKSIVVQFDEGTGTYIASCRGCLPLGDYEVRESEASEGYRINESWSMPFSITHAGEVADVTADADALPESVIRGGVRVQKDDIELGASEALGGKGHASEEGACLAGIEFTITNESDNPVIVRGASVEPGDVAETIITAWNDEQGVYCAQTAEDELPYGTYAIRETASNGSYHLTDGEPRIFHVREDGVIVDVDSKGDGLMFANQVVRNDVELSKKASDTNAAVQAAFLLTNIETGEAHVLVCDRNGDASTASSWNPHTRNTNANDVLIGKDDIKASDFDLNAGIWFGLGEDGSMAEPNDELAAMPFGHYLLQELRSDSNAGYDLVERELWITRDSSVARAVWMDLDDRPAERIVTQASDASDGDAFAEAAEQVTIKDVVSYENLRTDGREYTIRGTLMAKSTGKPLLDARGNRITASKTFRPQASVGTIELEFTFDASSLAGETVVVFEELLQDGNVVAKHADINDEGQSVKIFDKPYVPEDPQDGTPKTGDGIPWMSIACLAGAALCSAGIAFMAYRRGSRGDA